MSKSHYLELSYRQRWPLNRVILMWALFHTLLENAQKLKENLMVISCLPTCLGKWYWKVKTSSPSVLITLSTNTHRSLQQEYTNLKLAPVLHTVPLNWYVSPHSPPTILCQASRITVGGCVTYSRGHSQGVATLVHRKEEKWQGWSHILTLLGSKLTCR